VLIPGKSLMVFLRHPWNGTRAQGCCASAKNPPTIGLGCDAGADISRSGPVIQIFARAPWPWMGMSFAPKSVGGFATAAVGRAVLHFFIINRVFEPALCLRAAFTGW